MLEIEGICEKGRKEYEEKQRLLLVWLMSEKDGILMKSATDPEIERNSTSSSRTW